MSEPRYKVGDKITSEDGVAEWEIHTPYDAAIANLAAAISKTERTEG